MFGIISRANKRKEAAAINAAIKEESEARKKEQQRQRTAELDKLRTADMHSSVAFREIGDSYFSGAFGLGTPNATSVGGSTNSSTNSSANMIADINNLIQT